MKTPTLACQLNGHAHVLVCSPLNHVERQAVPLRYWSPLLAWAGDQAWPVMLVIPQPFGGEPIRQLRTLFSLS